MLGELRSVSIALPGSVGLFLLLQEAFQHEDPMRPRLNLSKSLHSFLNNFRWLAKDVAVRPQRIAELVLDAFPATVGACDAAGTGMGGFTLFLFPTARSHLCYGDSVFCPGSNANWFPFPILM